MMNRKYLFAILGLNITLISCDLKITDTSTTLFKSAIQLTKDNSIKSDPAWSPDGTMIAYSRRTAEAHFFSVSLNESDTSPIGYVEDDIHEYFDLSPDGKQIVYRSRIKEHLWIGDLQTGSKRLLTPYYPDAHYPAWSPDGKRIAFANDYYYYSRRILEIPATGGNPVEIIYDPEGASYPSWSPDGKQIAYQSYHNNYVIKILDIENQESRQLTPDTTSNYDPDWSPDGTKIAYYSQRNDTLAIWTIPTNGGKETILTKNLSYAKNPVWSPDGLKIAFKISNNKIAIASADGDILHQMHLTTEYPVWWPAGDALVQTQRKSHSNIEIFSLKDSLTKPLTKAGNFQYDSHPAWYPNSDTIAFVGSSKIWTIPSSGGEATILNSNIRGIYNPAISPDGKWLMYNYSNRINFISLPERKPLDISIYPGYSLTEPAWAPDSKSFICSRSNGLDIFTPNSFLGVDKRTISGNFSHPSWSVPHPVIGSHIAAESNWNIYIMRPDGTNQEFVGVGLQPSWSPDGTRICCIKDDQLYILTVFVDF